MRKYVFLAALVLASALPTVAAAKPDQYGFQKPIFGPRAAPWYVYWPYPSYFNTPAPTGVAFPPGVMTPGNFQAHMYGGFVPYPTNGFGQ